MLTEVVWKWLDTIDIAVTDRVLTSGAGGMSWILLQLLLHTVVSTIGNGGITWILLQLFYTVVSTIGTSMSWILLQLLLHTVVSTIGTGMSWILLLLLQVCPGYCYCCCTQEYHLWQRCRPRKRKLPSMNN